MASNNRKQVLRAIDALSDSEGFKEDDSDRDSNYNPSDREESGLENYSDSDSEAENADRSKPSQKQRKTTDLGSRCANSPNSHVTVLQPI